MAKLSGLASSAKVTLEIGQQKIACNWLEYNHYGKSEVTLYIPGYWSTLAIALNMANAKNNEDGSKFNVVFNSLTYFDSQDDTMCQHEIPFMLDDSISKSLVKVSISDGNETRLRSVFKPSTTEAGMSKYYGQTASSRWTYDTIGTKFSTLSSLIEENTALPSSSSFDSFWGSVSQTHTQEFNVNGAITTLLRGHLSGPNFGLTLLGTKEINSYLPRYLMPGASIVCYNNGHYYISGKTYTSNAFPYVSITPRSNDTTATSIKMTSTYQPYSLAGQPYNGDYIWSMGHALYRDILICLNGNCEVTGSGTSWTISKPTAIETYRKMDGVWYRTI